MSKNLKLVTIPDNGQISVGKEFAGKQVEIRKLENGSILITPGKFIPDNQKTFFTTESKDLLEEFNKWEEKESPQHSSVSDLRKKLKAKKYG